MKYLLCLLLLTGCATTPIASLTKDQIAAREVSREKSKEFWRGVAVVGIRTGVQVGTGILASQMSINGFSKDR